MNLRCSTARTHVTLDFTRCVRLARLGACIGGITEHCLGILVAMSTFATLFESVQLPERNATKKRIATT